MQNLFYPVEEYTKRREQLRKLPVQWRDMSSSASVPAWQESICDERFRIGSETCAQVGYNLLKAFYPDLNLRWQKSEMELLAHRPPKVFRFRVVGNLYYLDIKSAYKQLYQYLYLHSWFPYREQKYPLYNLAQTFNDKEGNAWKIARNSIVGITASTKNKWVCGQKVWYVPKRNRYLSPTLWAQIQGLLNQIASEMIGFGAIWVNTDGYAFTSEEGYLKAINFLTERGIAIGDKGNGHGYINGLNSVHIQGVKDTDNNQSSREVYHLETSDIDHLSYWMKNRERFLK